MNPYGSALAVDKSSVVTERPKIPAIIHILCGWPLLLIAVGGAVGGGLGGAAYAINVATYKTQLPLVLKLVLNVMVGCAAIGIWLTAAVAVQMARQ